MLTLSIENLASPHFLDLQLSACLSLQNVDSTWELSTADQLSLVNIWNPAIWVKEHFSHLKMTPPHGHLYHFHSCFCWCNILACTIVHTAPEFAKQLPSQVVAAMVRGLLCKILIYGGIQGTHFAWTVASLHSCHFPKVFAIDNIFHNSIVVSHLLMRLRCSTHWSSLLILPCLTSNTSKIVSLPVLY